MDVEQAATELKDLLAQVRSAQDAAIELIGQVRSAQDEIQRKQAALAGFAQFVAGVESRLRTVIAAVPTAADFRREMHQYAASQD